MNAFGASRINHCNKCILLGASPAVHDERDIGGNDFRVGIWQRAEGSFVVSLYRCDDTQWCQGNYFLTYEGAYAHFITLCGEMLADVHRGIWTLG